MTTQAELIAALRRKFKEPDAAIARRVGLSQQRFNNYAASRRTMDDDAVIGCATALGIDPQEALASHRAETAATPRERAFWRRFGAAAALALCAVALPQVIDTTHRVVGVLHIMSMAGLVTAWLAWSKARFLQEIQA